MIVSVKSSWNTPCLAIRLTPKIKAAKRANMGVSPDSTAARWHNAPGGKVLKHWERRQKQAVHGWGAMLGNVVEHFEVTIHISMNHNLIWSQCKKYVPNMYRTIIRVWMNWWCFSKRIHWLKWYLAYVQFQRHHHSKHTKGNKPHGRWLENSAIGNRCGCMPSAPEHRVVSYIAQQRHQPDGKTWNLPITGFGFWIHFCPCSVQPGFMAVRSRISLNNNVTSNFPRQKSTCHDTHTYISKNILNIICNKWTSTKTHFIVYFVNFRYHIFNLHLYPCKAPLS